jgi:DNA repair protein RadA/Sms
MSAEIVVRAEEVNGVPYEGAPAFQCEDCLFVSMLDKPRCPSCGTCNSLREFDRAMVAIPGMEAASGRDVGGEVLSGGSGTGGGQVYRITDLLASIEVGKVPTGEPSLDHVLGEGMQVPSVILIGGDPGVGKSTLLTQIFGNAAMSRSALYACGEESKESVGIRCKRLGVVNEQSSSNMLFLQGTDFDLFMETLDRERPKLIVLDSLQKFATDKIDNKRAGSPPQMVYVSEHFHTWCHLNNAVGWLVCHVTKGGDFQGPNTVDHAVDVNLMLSKADDGTVVATTSKNRFGSAENVGFFMHKPNGLKSHDTGRHAYEK